jgi:hypothetical protein
MLISLLKVMESPLHITHENYLKDGERLTHMAELKDQEPLLVIRLAAFNPKRTLV